jgi:hypothetical protein
MYLHLLDSHRDKSLVNKSADLLTDEEQIPGCWWDPIPPQRSHLLSPPWQVVRAQGAAKGPWLQGATE